MSVNNIVFKKNNINKKMINLLTALIRQCRKDLIKKIEKTIKIEQWEKGRWIKAGILIKKKDWELLREKLIEEDL